jgi:hypothetical protein
MPSQSPFSQTLYRYLEKAELILLAALAVSLLARYLQMNGYMTGLQISLSGLAGVYFLMAYRPPASQPEGERKGFADLLAVTILPKVLWIGCAVGAIGILFYLLQLEGARQMMLIHTGAGGIGLGMFLAARQSSSAAALTEVLYRAIPLLMVSVYFLTVA